MLLSIRKIETIHLRNSKLGLAHEYKKVKNILIMRCDNCNAIFERELSTMSPERRTNSYFHVCNNCDTKRFAQRKGVERRFIWNKLASSADDISKL